ncbi:MAG: hypothetical protein ACE5FW_01020 [Candidatus Aenigmatarchaeota archaeon]
MERFNIQERYGCVNCLSELYRDSFGHGKGRIEVDGETYGRISEGLIRACLVLDEWDTLGEFIREEQMRGNKVSILAPYTYPFDGNDYYPHLAVVGEGRGNERFLLRVGQYEPVGNALVAGLGCILTILRPSRGGGFKYDGGKKKTKVLERIAGARMRGKEAEVSTRDMGAIMERFSEEMDKFISLNVHVFSGSLRCDVKIDDDEDAYLKAKGTDMELRRIMNKLDGFLVLYDGSEAILG